jgi:hypothetical protein
MGPKSLEKEGMNPDGGKCSRGTGVVGGLACTRLISHPFQAIMMEASCSSPAARVHVAWQSGWGLVLCLPCAVLVRSRRALGPNSP